MKRKQHGMFVSNQNKIKSPHNKINEKMIESVRKHIGMFPKVESHYTRKDTKKEYISGDLNIRRMWKLYVQLCKKNNDAYVKESKYRKIFCEEFNISFFKPKGDKCSTCHLYEMKVEAGSVDDATEKKFIDHQERKVEARLEKDKDKAKAI